MVAQRRQSGIPYNEQSLAALTAKRALPSRDRRSGTAAPAPELETGI